MTHRLIATRIIPVLLFAIGLPLNLKADDDAFFERNIRPVLAGTCFKCHGGERTAGKFRVDSRDALLKGGASGAAIVPGDPDQSLLVRALRRKDDVTAMPPDKALPAETVANFAAWVKSGARWPAATASFTSRRHWAFEPLQSVRPPDLPGEIHPVDCFIDAKLREHGLTPAGPADRLTLIRRVTFDLIGLPPTPEEIDVFLKDDSPAAFSSLVERLLASPHYGERWGRHWLDVVRYADTAGETADYPVPQAWRYRNYVIAAFNRDQRYDQFLREQVAGDLLAKDANLTSARRAELVTATGFVSIARRFGFDILADQYLTIEDTIDTLGKSVLGLTLACARCHDHKYDPVSQRDYYALYGIFESTHYPYPGSEKVKVPSGLVPVRRGCWLNPTELIYAVAEGQPHDAQLHKRGNADDRGDFVPRHFPPMFGDAPVPQGSGSGRLQLADWLLGPAKHLTARVMVNRIWQNHFGVGLVKTPNDFGTRGSPPTHLELLDWLATKFIESDWSIKSMHRLIVSSQTYQRSSHAELGARNAEPKTGPSSTLHAPRSTLHAPRRRLSAEEIRDAILAISGDLDRTPGTAHPFPPPAGWGFTQHAPFSAVYDHNRRSVYLMTQRIKRHPFLALFDGADTNASTGTRFATTVPTQALFFFNDPFVHDKAAHFAKRLEAYPTDEIRLDRACRLMYGRPALESEQQAAKKFLDEYAEALPPSSAPERRRTAWAAWLRVMFASNEFIYVD